MFGFRIHQVFHQHHLFYLANYSICTISIVSSQSDQIRFFFFGPIRFTNADWDRLFLLSGKIKESCAHWEVSCPHCVKANVMDV